MLNKIKNYCLDSNFKFTYFDNQLDIINYKEIIVLEETHISFRYNTGIMKVNGKGLTVKKLLDQEVLIVGDIKSIELGDEHV